MLPEASLIWPSIETSQLLSAELSLKGPFPSLAPYAALVTLRKDQRDTRLAEVPGTSHPRGKVQVTS